MCDDPAARTFRGRARARNRPTPKACAKACADEETAGAGTRRTERVGTPAKRPGPVHAAGRVRVGGIRASGARRWQIPRRRTRKQPRARRTPSSGHASPRPRLRALRVGGSRRPPWPPVGGHGWPVRPCPRTDAGRNPPASAPKEPRSRRAGKSRAGLRPGRRAGRESRPAMGPSSTGVHSCLLVVGGEAKGVSANKTTADAGPRKLAASNPTAGASTSAEPTVNPSHTMACSGRAGRLTPAQLRSMSLTPPAPSVCLMRRGPCRPLPIAGSDRSCGAGTCPSGVSLRSSTPRA